jgi:acylphosphatase
MKRSTGRQFVISGRVQGVGFRYFAQHQAMTLGLSGWVRNLADGSVEAYAFGPHAALEDFEARLRRGPSFADVRNVDVIDTDRSDNIEGFHIR